MLRPTPIACIHVRDHRCAIWVKVGDHVGMSTHVTELCEAEIRLPESRGGGTGTCLKDVSKLVGAIVTEYYLPCIMHRSQRKGQSEQRIRHRPPDRRSDPWCFGDDA